MLLLLGACGASENAMGGAVGTGRASDGGGVPVETSPPAAHDAGAYDTKLYDGDHYLCGYDDSDRFEFSGNGALRVLSSANDERGYALIHLDVAGNLLVEALPLADDAQAPVVLLDANAQVEAATVVANGQDFMLAWRSAREGQHLSTRLLRAGQAAVEQSAALKLASGGELFASVAFADGFALAFVDQSGGKDSLRVRRLDRQGVASGDDKTFDTIAARKPEHLQLAATDGGALLAWFQHQTATDPATPGSVMAASLSAGLALSPDEASQLSKNAVAEPAFALAARERSEGLIYHAKDGDIRDTVKYRRVETSGKSTQAVLNMVNAPFRARDGSIAPFGQGYAVAYRKLPSLGESKATIHVAFVNEFGQSVYDAELADATEDAGPTTVTATENGHVLVGWTNALGRGATTSARRLYCPGALVLCGGSVK